jgi:cytoskeletal protein CcmA (bactofilin family)
LIKPPEGSTVIGKSVTIRGEVSASEDLYVDGLLEGTVHLPDSRLTIGPNARITAELNVRDLILFGRLDGNVTATGRVELRDAAVVNGNLSASRLSMEETTTVHGKVELTNYASGSKSTEPSPSV